MAEPFLLVVFKVIWQDLVESLIYDSTKQDWQALQIVIDEIKKNKQVNQDLAVAIEKCFYSSDKTIAEKCRDELIKNSTYTQYRGAKIYKPLENDTGIRKLENKIAFSEKQLKQFDKKLFAKKSFFNIDELDEIMQQLSQSNYESSEQAKKYTEEQLFEILEQDCNVNIYITAIRDKKNGLRTKILNSFLREIEPNQQLNRIFKARTHLILSQVRNQS